MTDSGTAEKTARDVHQSTAVDALARVGLASRGLVWLVVALIALSIVGGGGGEADQQGALRAIAAKPLGEVLLVVLVVGFCGYAFWQGLNAAVGGADALKRVGAAGKSLVYLGLAASVVRFLAAGQTSSGGDPADSLTGRLMRQPGGRTMVGLVGLVVVGIGVALAVRAVKGKHAKKIDQGDVPAGKGRLVVRIGIAGYVGRGLTFCLIGVFLVVAAVQADPDEAKGLDAALHDLAGRPYGQVLLVIAAMGLLAYALWSFLEAAFHRHDSRAS